MKFRLQDILKVLVSLSALVLIIIFVDFSEIFSGLQKLSVPFVVAALLFYTGCQWLSCWRWQIILRSTGYRARMGVLFSSYFGGMFLNTLLPGAVGGDAYRVYRIAQQSQQSELAFVSVFLERITGVFALLAIALISIPPAFSLIGLWDVILLLVLCTAMVAGMVMLIASPRLLKFSQPWLNRLKLRVLSEKLSNIQHLLRVFAQHRLAMALTLLLSVLFQLLVVLYYYLIAQQLQISVSYLQLLIFTAIIVAITLLPISLGGLGVKEGLLVYLFSRVGLSAEEAIVLSLTVTALSWLLSLPGGLVLLLDSTDLKAIR